MDLKFLSPLKIFMVLVIAFVLIANSSRTSCPRRINIEKGNNMTISCNPNDIQVPSFYWYKGDPSLSGPILRLEEGVPGGSEYGKERYDITAEGAMTIIDATVDHEGLYSLLAYFDDGSFENNNVTLHLTITPLHGCPLIEKCTPCEGCNKIVNGTETLKCSITQSRPKIPLKWSIISAKGIEIFKSVETADEDYLSGTWNTSTMISYKARSCNQQAVLQCVARDEIHVMKYTESSINLYTDNCTRDIVDIENESSGARVIMLAVTLSAFFFVAFITCGVCYNRRRRNRAKSQGRYPDEHLGLNTDGSSYSPPSRAMSTEVKRMISNLKEVYQPYCFIKALPFADQVPINDLYIDCQCEVKYPNGATLALSSTELLNEKNFTSQRHAVVVGNKGWGKTVLLQKKLKLWVDGKEDDFLLIFTSLRGAKIDMKLIDVVRKNMCTSNKLNFDKLEKAISSHDCLIILDGLEDMFSDNEYDSGNGGNDYYSRDVSDDVCTPYKCLTVGELFKTELKERYPNMKVIITTCDLENMLKMGLKEVCTVKLKGFTDERIKQYVRNTCLYQVGRLSNASNNYVVKCKGEKSLRDSDKLPNMPSSEEERERMTKDCSNDAVTKATDHLQDDIYNNVYKFLEKFELISIFREMPSLLFFITRKTVTKFVTTVSNQTNENIWNIAVLTECIVRKLLDTSDMHKKKLSQEDIQYLIKSLEDIAIQSKFEKIAVMPKKSSNKSYDDSIDLAINVGLLRRETGDMTVKEVSAESIQGNNVTFCHQSFRDCLAACSIAKNPQYLNDLKKDGSKDEEGELLGLVKFISSMETAQVEEICNIFLKNEWFNCIIDFLFYTRDQNPKTRIMEEICDKKLVLRYLQNDYHRTAVIWFCKTFKDTAKKLKSVSFRGKLPSSFIDALPVDIMTNLEFVNATFNEQTFANILEKLSNEEDTKTLRFVYCDLEDISKTREQIEQLKNFKGKPRVYRVSKTDDGVIPEFNYNTMKFELGKFEKLVKKVVSN